MASQTLNLIQRLSKNGAKPALLSEIAKWFDEYAPKFQVVTPKRISAFLSNAAHETDGFRSLTEYASGAEYESRADLGNTQKGDGVKFKGRGIFQITGRGNYATMNARIKKDFGIDLDLLNYPERLAAPQWAVVTAFYYWIDRNLNKVADLPDTWLSDEHKIGGVMKKLNPFEYIAYRINGGQNGITERKAFYATALDFINKATATAVSAAKNNPLTVLLFLVVAIAIVYLISK